MKAGDLVDVIGLGRAQVIEVLNQNLVRVRLRDRASIKVNRGNCRGVPKTRDLPTAFCPKGPRIRRARVSSDRASLTDPR